MAFKKINANNILKMRPSQESGPREGAMEQADWVGRAHWGCYGSGPRARHQSTLVCGIAVVVQ